MDPTNQKSDNSVMSGGAGNGVSNDGTGKFADLSREQTANFAGVIKLDPWLAPFKDEIKKRFSKTQDWIKKIDETEGGLEKFSRVRGHIRKGSIH